MIVILDNKDSFVWNLAEYVSIFDKVKILPNSATISEIKKLNPDGLIISPGPGSPDSKRDTGNCCEIVLNMDIPILGVCLGHQIIAHAFGGIVGKVKPVHGKASKIEHNCRDIFNDVKNPLDVGRYHSLAVLRVPKKFEVTARLINDSLIMGIKHRSKDIYGVQFHPESVLTPRTEGLKIVGNFLSICR